MNSNWIAGRGARWIAALATTFIVSAAQAQEAPPVMSDWGGTRTTLRERGTNIGINYIGETLQVMSGGIRRAASFEGRLELVADADLEKLVGIKGLSTHAK